MGDIQGLAVGITVERGALDGPGQWCWSVFLLEGRGEVAWGSEEHEHWAWTAAFRDARTYTHPNEDHRTDAEREFDEGIGLDPHIP